MLRDFKSAVVVMLLGAVVLAASAVQADESEPVQRGRHGWGHGRQGGGPGGGRGYGWGRGGPMQDNAAFQQDRDTFHFLLERRDAIRRTVKNTKRGVKTLTESDDPEVSKRIQEHVESMAARVEENRPIHMRDPLFRALFGKTKQIEMKVEKTPKGVRVVETSDDAFVAKLIQAHAAVVSQFIKNGHIEVSRNHAVPTVADDASAK